jgi:hypothetical protein
MENLYLSKIIETPEFKRLLELKDIINDSYKKEIMLFKTKESLYLEASERKEYYSNYDQIKKSFIDAKANLYSKEEVLEYFRLERELQDMINNDINELKESISNKFTLDKILKI